MSKIKQLWRWVTGISERHREFLRDLYDEDTWP